MPDYDELPQSRSALCFSFEKAQERLAIIAIVFIICFCMILLRIMMVIIPENSPLSENRILEKNKTVLRSDILDRNGNIIVTSLPTVNVYANPSKIPNKGEKDLKITAKKLAISLNASEKDIFNKLNRKGEFIYLKRNIVPKEQYDTNKLGLPWIDFEESERRVYPGKNLFSHIVGAVNTDNKGIAGIEKQYDSYLKTNYSPLRLSLDIAIQDTIRRILKKGIEEFKASAGNAILMDVNTSEIIAMVSLPDFDPNDFNNVKEKELFNRNTSGIYETGSIFKIFNTAMYLNNGGNINKIFNTTEPIKIGKRVIRDYMWQKEDLNVTEIIVKSSNLGSARIALETGGEKQKKFMEKLGFLEATKIEIPERASPLVPERWNDATQTVVATISYGYGLSVSPLHIITSASGIVNNGKFKDATLIKNKDRLEKRIVNIKTSKQIRDILRTIVFKGSGRKAYAKGYDVGGKTGSARRTVSGKYTSDDINTSFIAIFPIYNPRYSLLVMLDSPQKKEGDRTNDAGLNSALIAGEMIESIAPQLKIIPKDIKK